MTRSKRILTVSHSSPDGDAIGSLLALGLSLSVLNKALTFYNESQIPAVYRFLPHTDRIVQQIDNVGIYDTAVILDCSDMERIGNMASRVALIPAIINIDHHITNSEFGQFHLIDTEACATAEIVYRLITAMNIPIDTAIATCIYTGILTDTGSFRFSNTNQTTFEICRQMTALGVSPYHVAQHVYGTYSLGRIRLLNRALDSIEISKDGKISLMTLTKDMLEETGTHPEDIDGFINYAKRIEDVKVAVLIQENGNGRQHVSLRSDGSVDVADIASSFGGGGHRSAAGFSIEASTVKLKKELLARIRV